MHITATQRSGGADVMRGNGSPRRPDVVAPARERVRSCVCVRACLRACWWARVRVCVRAYVYARVCVVRGSVYVFCACVRVSAKLSVQFAPI
jgi:hypothetical protein